MTHQRTLARRQASPRRKPWHVDYMAQRWLLHDIIRSRDYAVGRLLDVGCGSRPYAPWLSGVREYVGTDALREVGTPDLVSLAAELPFAADSFDTVLSTQTLEHTETPHLVVAEMARVLQPGGHLILTAPQAWRLHEQPHDFYRFTRYGLAFLLEQHGIEPLCIAAQGGVWVTIGQTFNNAIHARLRQRLPLYLRYGIYLCSNLAAVALDQLWHDPDETINYLVVGRKSTV